MIRRLYERLFYRYKRRYVSLYVGLALASVAGILAGAMLYVLGRLVSYSIVTTRYDSPEEENARAEAYIQQLQNIIDEEDLSYTDTERLYEWASSNHYLYLTLYAEGVVYFDSSRPEKTALPDTAIDTDEKRAEGIAFAEEMGLFVLDFRDGTVAAALSDFSAFIYYDIGNIVSLFLALLAMATIIISYIKAIIVRVKRLGSDVTVVTYGDNSRPIGTEGYDDIAKLAVEVEMMRQNMLDNIRREREAREANNDLITSMSHDIRTPLTVILGYLDMIKNDLPAEQRNAYVEACEKTALRLKELSDDMFRYFLAFGNAGKNVALEDYDAATLIEQMLTEHLLLLSESGYETEVEEESDAVFEEGSTITTDPSNLMRIIDNVFSNFYKYADKSEPILLHISRLGDILVLKFTNKIKADSSGVESNKIGLKSCDRIAELITEGFEYKAEEGYYYTRLALKINPPPKDSGAIALAGEEIYD